jgi:hypothetical protein
MDQNFVQKITTMDELPQPILQMIVLRADDRTKARVAQTNMQWRQFVNQHFHQSAKLNLTGTQIGLDTLRQWPLWSYIKELVIQDLVLEQNEGRHQDVIGLATSLQVLDIRNSRILPFVRYLGGPVRVTLPDAIQAARVFTEQPLELSFDAPPGMDIRTTKVLKRVHEHKGYRDIATKKHKATSEDE